MYNGRGHSQPPQCRFSGERLQPSMVHCSQAMQMFPQPAHVYGTLSTQPSFNPNAHFVYGSVTNVATSIGQAFTQVGVPYMSRPYGQPLVPMPVHLVQTQFMYGSTPQLNTVHQGPGFYMAPSPAAHYAGSPVVAAKYKTVMGSRMGCSTNGLQSFASVPDLSTIGNHDQPSVNVKALCSPQKSTSDLTVIHSPNYNECEFQMRRVNSEWNLSTAVISEPGVTTPHPSNSRNRRRFICGSNRQSFSSGFHSGESSNRVLDLDCTDPSLNEEVTLLGISHDGEADEQPRGDTCASLFKVPQMKPRRKGRSDRRSQASHLSLRQ